MANASPSGNGAPPNGGLRFSPEAARRLGCPQDLAESAERLGALCTAPPPDAQGGIWAIEITSPEEEEGLLEDTYRRRRAAGHPPADDPLGDRSLEELDAEDEAVADHELADLDTEARADVIAGWRRTRRSVERSQAVQERVYRAPLAPLPFPRSTPVPPTPRPREVRPRLRRSAARRASGPRSGQDPGEGEDDPEPAQSRQSLCSSLERREGLA